MRPTPVKLFGCSISLVGLLLTARGEGLKPLEDFRSAAKDTNAAVTIPDWPQNAAAMEATMKNAIAQANAALDRIGAQDRTTSNFKNTVVALDDLIYEASRAGNLAARAQETSTNLELRRGAGGALKTFEDWRVGVDYRVDVFVAIKAFAATDPMLAGEDRKLLEETLRDYRRAGLGFATAAREEIAQLRKELAHLGADFQTNTMEATAPVVFTKTELEGVSESLLTSPGVKTGADSYILLANLEAHYAAIEENARSEATRKKFYAAHETVAKDKNIPILNWMLVLRNKIAFRLGYKSWADFQTEIRMVKTSAHAEQFVNDLTSRIEPKFQVEVAALRKMKAAETKDPNARLSV